MYGLLSLVCAGCTRLLQKSAPSHVCVTDVARTSHASRTGLLLAFILGFCTGQSPGRPLAGRFHHKNLRLTEAGRPLSFVNTPIRSSSSLKENRPFSLQLMEEALKEKRTSLRRRNSLDRSAPLIDDAAHPGSAMTLRRISVGHFDLKHVDETSDRSAPVLEPGTGAKLDKRASLIAEIVEHKGSFSLKSPERTNDRSAPIIERYPMDVTKKPPAKAVVEELKEKRDSIAAVTESVRRKSIADFSQVSLITRQILSLLPALAGKRKNIPSCSAEPLELGE